MKVGTKRHWQSSAVMLLTAIAFILSTIGVFAHTADYKSDTFHPLSHPFIFPPNSRPFGRTYGEWSNAWWQWVFSIPAPRNPLLDTIGANCSEGQSGPVWFLAGTLGGPVTRSCIIPAGKSLLIPLVNVQADNVACTPPTHPLTVAELRGQTNGFIAAVTTLKAKIDGEDIQHLWRFRAGPNNPPYNFTLPKNNLYSRLLGCNIPPGTYGPAVSDGYYLIVAPLSPGRHTIHYESRVPSFNLTENVTYNLIVQEESKHNG